MIVKIPLRNQGLSGELFMDLLVKAVPCPHGTTDPHERPQLPARAGAVLFQPFADAKEADTHMAMLARLDPH
jgi:hypothetical protein